jgi:hypothetical protein
MPFMPARLPVNPVSSFYFSKLRACILDAIEAFVIRLPTLMETLQFQAFFVPWDGILGMFQIRNIFSQLALLHDSGHQLDHSFGSAD